MEKKNYKKNVKLNPQIDVPNDHSLSTAEDGRIVVECPREEQKVAERKPQPKKKQYKPKVKQTIVPETELGAPVVPEQETEEILPATPLREMLEDITKGKTVKVVLKTKDCTCKECACVRKKKLPWWRRFIRLITGY